MISQANMQPITPEHLAFAPVVWQQKIKCLQHRGYTVSKHEHTERMTIANETIRIVLCNNHTGNLLIVLDKPVRVSRVVEKKDRSEAEFYQMIIDSVEELLLIAENDHATMLADLFVDVRDKLNRQVISVEFLSQNEDMILRLADATAVQREGTA